MNTQNKVILNLIMTLEGLEILKPKAMLEMQDNWDLKSSTIKPLDGDKSTFTEEEIEFAAARQLVPWKRLPHSWKEFFYFPNPGT